METTAPTATARKPHAVGAPTTGRHRPAAAAAATTASRGGSDRKRRSSTARRRPLQVEAILHRELLRDDLSSTTAATIRSMIQDWVQSVARSEMVYRAGPVDLAKAPASITAACTRVSIVDLDEFLESAGERVEASTNEGTVAIWRVSDVQAHICFLYGDETSAEKLCAGAGNGDEDRPSEGGTGGEQEDTAGAVADVLCLPHIKLDGLWDSMILPMGVKSSLLSYAESSLLFSDRRVCPHVVGSNRVLLLHGPPGTGKSSLCRALAHKLCARLSGVYPNGGKLLEVRSHSLYSRWFGESGRLVSRLFDRVGDVVEEDKNALVCVLLDEVESMAASRSGDGGTGREPSDAVRAVNSLLTSLDRLKVHRNVLILATSNLTEKVDAAFVDRADVKQHIGLPILEARFEILRGCVLELARVGIIRCGVEHDQDTDPNKFCDYSKEKDGSSPVCTTNALDATRRVLPTYLKLPSPPPDPAAALLECAKLADGLSGRSLRRLPLQSHALFIRSSDPVDLGHFLDALMAGVGREQEARIVIELQNQDGEGRKQVDRINLLGIPNSSKNCGKRI